jgi:hypothetical protein
MNISQFFMYVDDEIHARFHAFAGGAEPCGKRALLDKIFGEPGGTCLVERANTGFTVK